MTDPLREAIARVKEIAAAIEFGPGDGISFREKGAVTHAADLRAILAALPTDTVQPVGGVDREAFQARVLPWLMECFGADIAANIEERCDRFIEEALEQVQALGWDKARAIALVDYVYGRPAGEPHQEAGGVMVTFAALCQAAGLDMQKAGDDELARIMRPEIVQKIRAKQAAKPAGSALPVALYATAPTAGSDGEHVCEWRLIAETQDAQYFRVTTMIEAAREAGWAMMEVVDSISWERRQRFSDIAARLAKSIEAVECQSTDAPTAGSGWVMVPREPTPKMLAATWDHDIDKNGGIESQNTRNERATGAAGG